MLETIRTMLETIRAMLETIRPILEFIFGPLINLFRFMTRYPVLFKNILLGIRFTVILSIASAFFGLLIGTLLALCKLSKNKLLKWAANIYTDIFRGTPVLLQLSIVYYLIFAAFDAPLIAAITTFSLNSAAYVSEIMRAGIQNVDKGQVEAAKAMGVSEKDIALDILIPQAFRKTLPPIINELATLIKESSIVYIISVRDIMYQTERASKATYLYFEPYIIAGICYYILVKLIAYLGKYVEVKMSYDNNK